MQTQENKIYNNLVPGWLGTGDQDAISTIASLVHAGGIIVEVGSMHGKSACCMASAAPDATIYCYDYWPGNDIKASDNIIRSNTLDTFKLFTKVYQNIVPNIVDNNLDYRWEGHDIDLFFIDAAHTNPTDWQTIMYWLPKIKHGGIICGHDYYTAENSNTIHYPDVNINIDRLSIMIGKSVTLHKNSCVWSFTL